MWVPTTPCKFVALYFLIKIIIKKQNKFGTFTIFVGGPDLSQMNRPNLEYPEVRSHVKQGMFVRTINAFMQ